MFSEKEPFLRRVVRPDALEPFGFVQTPDGYRYAEPFLDGAFRAEILIDEAGGVYGSVVDCDLEEEYLPIRTEAGVGAFVGSVREGYQAILSRIAAKCFQEEPFIFPQTNRIALALERRYGDRFDHPFRTAKTYAAFRHPDTRKWYGLVMDIKRSLLTKEPAETAPKVEVVNLKIDPDRFGALTAIPGIFPAYHMKRPEWISVLLDDTVPDETVLELLDRSRSFAAHGGKKTPQDGRTNWIVPGNPRYYDVDAAFAKSEEILWKQSSDVRIGDIVYLYVGAPVSAVRYRCEAVAVNLPYAYDDPNVCIRRVMRIRRLKTYAPDALPFSKLCELGIRAVRGPRTVTAAFLEYEKSL